MMTIQLLQMKQSLKIMNIMIKRHFTESQLNEDHVELKSQSENQTDSSNEKLKENTSYKEDRRSSVVDDAKDEIDQMKDTSSHKTEK